MTTIVFDTPGKIDMRSFTVMGLSAKPGSGNPIGKFGTGLKYAVAVLVRLGCEPVVWIGRDKHVFVKKKIDFRGTEAQGLALKSLRWGLSRWRTTELPFTTSYGLNWEPWMVFRELEANTRDEAGFTTTFEGSADQVVNQDENRTVIAVDLEAFVEAYHKREEIFLKDGQREGTGVQVVDGRSNHLYWRGMKVYKTQKPTLFTYNFMDNMMLTEDRTMAHEYFARAVFARWLVKSNSDHLISSVLQADSQFWESGLDFPTDEAPGPAFIRVMARYPKRVSAAAWGYYARYDDRVTEKTFDLKEAHPFPWSIVGNSVVDAKERVVFDAPYNYNGKWDLVAKALLYRLNPLEEEPEVDEPVEEPVDAESAQRDDHVEQ